MESTSYVLSFRVVFFYLVTTGWIFEISLCENSIHLLFLFFFLCSADHERDWPPCKVVFFGLATNALDVRNNNK